MINRMVRFFLTAGILFSMLALSVQGAAAAGTDRYVATSGTDSGDCTNQAAPCKSIAYAITQSSKLVADFIHIAAGTYYEYLTLDRSVSLDGAQENLTLIDGGTPAARQQGGGGLTLIVVDSGVTATLQDLNIQNAPHPGGDGGGIYNSGTLFLARVMVSGNSALIGGGIFNEGSLSLTDVFISGNSTTSGAGGGLFNDSADELSLTNVTLSNNTASGYSGGIHHQGTGGLKLTNVTFSGNTAHIGGAMAVTGVASVSIINSTIANNHIDSSGSVGGLAIYGTVTMVNTILNANDGANCGLGSGATLTSDGYNIEGAHSCLTSEIAQTSDHPDTDPLLAPLAKNGGYVPTFALLTGSPAIDAGSAASCPGMDAASWHRPQDGNGDGSFVCDIGAFEAPSIAKFTSSGTYDGWVRESTETSKVGGAIDSTGNLYLGDSPSKQQYRGILSFSTGSLPDAATITAVKLKVRQQSILGGGNPVTIFQGFMADVKKGTFGTAALQTSDFQAAANATYGPFNGGLSSGWYNINLTGAPGSINKLATGSGLTQIRLRFKLDDNNNAVANILSLNSGNATTAANRPQLVVSYYAP